MVRIVWGILGALLLANPGGSRAQAPSADTKSQPASDQSQSAPATQDDSAAPPLDPKAETVDDVVPFELAKVMAALKVAMESKDCNFTEATATRIECKRPRGYSYSTHMGYGGESVTAVLQAQGEQTHVHISTGKGIQGRFDKVNLSVPIYKAMMTTLEEGPAAPTTTPSAPAVSGEAPPVRLEDATPVDYTHWGYDPAPDAHLELKEIERKTVKGHTQLIYLLQSSGFPREGTYVLWHMQSGDHVARSFANLSGYTAAEGGKLACPGPSFAGTPPPSAGAHCIPLEKLFIRIDGYHKGEPMDYAIISTDGAVRAYVRGYPFPIQIQDGKCTLTVEMENSNFTSFVIRGAGFAPNEKITTSSSFGGEAAAATHQASAQGEFVVALRAELPGKNSGSATFTATGQSCHPSVSYEWGKAATKVQ
jgi:hypothetical protein